MEFVVAWTQILIAACAFFVSVVVAGFVMKEHRTAREAFVREMVREWNNLLPSWKRVLLAYYGHEFHYVDATPEERAAVARLTEELRVDGLEPGYSAALQLRSDVRRVNRFFCYAADSLYRGRWRMFEVYGVFGPDVARLYDIFQFLSFRKEPDVSWLGETVEFNTFDEHDCLYVFGILLRSEQCRRGDTYGHFIVRLAQELRMDSFDLRLALYRLALVRKRLLPIPLLVLFWRGKHPRLAAAFLVPNDPIVSPEEVDLFRRWFEPRRLFRFRFRKCVEMSKRCRLHDPSWD